MPFFTGKNRSGKRGTWTKKKPLEATIECEYRSSLEISAKSAITRTESRGVHFREDFPETGNDEWLAGSIVHSDADAVTVTKHPFTVTSMTPPEGKRRPSLEMTKQRMEIHSDTEGKD